MPDWFVTWLDRLSPWQHAFFIGITWLGLLAIHPALRRLLHGDEPSNEAIIYSAAASDCSMPSSSAC